MKSIKSKDGRGGARAGAGRKPTARDVKKTAAEVIFSRRADGGKEPLAIMLEAMDDAYKDGGAVAAFAFAQACAPFVNPKVSSAEITGANGKDLMPRTSVLNIQPNMTPEQIEALARGLGAIDDNEFDLND